MTTTSSSTDVFGATRALLRECLTFPGQSYRTIADAIGSHASSIRSWIAMDPPKTPKTTAERERIDTGVRTHLAALRSSTADPADCDPAWRSSIAAYMTGRGWTTEQLAASVGAPVHQVQRWIASGELPNDRFRKALREQTLFDFDASAIRRAMTIAREAHGGPFPPPLNGIMDPATLRAAIADLRGRAGVTADALATTLGLDVDRMRNIATAKSGNLRYGPEILADAIVRLARFAVTMSADVCDPVATALELLRSRPATPQGMTSGFTISWDRIAAKLQGGYRNLRYRQPDGEAIAVLLVRFAIAFEQSRMNAAAVSVRTGISTDLIDSWLHARSVPGAPQLDVLAEAVRILTGGPPRANTVPDRPDGTAPHGVPTAPPGDPLASAPSMPAVAEAPASPDTNDAPSEGRPASLVVAVPIPGILDAGIEASVLAIDGIILAVVVALKRINDGVSNGSVTPEARARYQRLLAGPLFVLHQQATQLMVPEPDGLPEALQNTFRFWEFPCPDDAKASRDRWREFLGSSRRRRRGTGTNEHGGASR